MRKAAFLLVALTLVPVVPSVDLFSGIACQIWDGPEW